MISVYKVCLCTHTCGTSFEFKVYNLCCQKVPSYLYVCMYVDKIRVTSAKGVALPSHTYTCTYIHTCVHTYIHTCTHV